MLLPGRGTLPVPPMEEDYQMELQPGIHIVDNVSCNVYLLIEGDELTLIDTGMQGNASKVVSYIRSIGRDPLRIVRILLTHQHVDHVGGAAALAALAHPRVYAHPLDVPAISGTGPRDVPGGPLGIAFRALHSRLKPVAVTDEVHENDVIPVFGEDGGLRVIETPGHTLGQIAFYLPGRKLLFAGDTYQHSGGQIAPPPRMLNCDNALALRTLRDLPEKVEIKASLPGHGAPILTGARALLSGAVKVTV